MTQEDKIINRIRKMMAIANDAAASEGERDNAMRMSHKLLAKHNLDMKQVEDSTAPEERGKCVMEGRNDPWARQIAFAIAGLFFCKYYYTPYTKETRVEHHFVGLESNTTTAMEISKYVINSVRAEAAKWAKEAGHGTPRDFCKGATARIAQRCDALRMEAEQESAAEATTGTALVLASVYQQEEQANAAFIEAMGAKLRQAKGRQQSANASGYQAGAAFGDRVSLNRQVGATAPRPN